MWWAKMKRNEIEGLLPDVIRRTAYPGSVLAALLDVMEAHHAPSEEVLATLDSFFDPYRTPDEFVPYLAGWVDLLRFLDEAPEGSNLGDVTFAGGLGRLRELIAAAAHLTRWRGTAHGLVLFLETATGVSGFVIEEDVTGPDGRLVPFHLRVVAPADAQPAEILIRQIVQMEKPAYVTFELAFGSA